jgi:hypothetical protein
MLLLLLLSSVSFLKNEHNSNKAYIGERVHEQEQLLILHVYTVRERSNTIVLLLTIWYQGTWNSFFALELFPGYNNSLCALQSDIGHSDIRLSQISLIRDIGLSAHLC